MRWKYFGFLLALFLLIVQLSFSRTEDEAFPIILVENKTYLLGEEVKAEAWLGFSNLAPLPNQTIKLSLISENSVLSMLGETNETGFFSLALPLTQEGIYELSFVVFFNSTEIRNSSFLLIKKPEFEISIQKENFKVNETVSFFISGPKNESFVLLIESQFLIQSLLLSTDENGTCSFNISFQLPGSYTARIKNSSVSFQVLPEEKEEEVFLDLSFLKEVEVNKSMQILVLGTANTNFNLKIFFFESLVYHFVSSTNEKGESYLNFIPIEIGNYTVELNYEDKILKKNFTAIISVENITSRREFKIILPEKEFFVGENVSVEILGESNSTLLLKLIGKEEKEFEIQTDENGSAFISFEVNSSGEYELKLFCGDSEVAEISFSVFEKVETSFLSLEQGKAKFGEEVKWNASILFKNLMNETQIVDLALFLPSEAEILSEEMELVLAPFEEKILNISFRTPAPFITEIESGKDLLTRKKFFLSSNCSLNYSNVSLTLEIPKFREMKVFLDEEEISKELYNITELNESLILQMEIPMLKENLLEIIGFNESKEDAEIFLENLENEIIECEKKLDAGKTYGILISSCKNITIRNCQISGYKFGIFVKNSELITLENNILKENKHGAVFLNSKEVYLKGNTAEENFGYGVLLYSTFGIYGEENRIRNNFDKEFLAELKLLA